MIKFSHLLSGLFVLGASTNLVQAGNPITETKVREIITSEIADNSGALKGATGAPGASVVIAAGTGGITVTESGMAPTITYTVGYTVPTAEITNPETAEVITIDGSPFNAYVGCVTSSGGLRNLTFLRPGETYQWNDVITATGAISMTSGAMNSNLVTTAGSAFSYCSTLNTTATPATTHLWYLPSLEELQCILYNYKLGKLPASGIPTSTYWSSTESIADNTRAFSLNFADSSTLSDTKTNAKNIFCVREVEF